jgi:hypothetical protein
VRRIAKDAASTPHPGGPATPGERSWLGRPRRSSQADRFHAGIMFWQRLHVLFFIEHGARHVHLAGHHRSPPARGVVTQQAFGQLNWLLS